MRATIGLNALAQTMDKGAFDAAIKLLKPAAALIMDDVGLARALKQQYPDMLVVHRSYFNGDEQGHLSMTPQAFMNAYGASGAGGIIVQALNEPSGSANIPQLINWCTELMALGRARGIRLALPNFGVGNPDDNAVRAGTWDGLLRAFAAYPEHYFAIHEYFRDEPKNEPYLIGRYRAFLERAAALGIPQPQIIVTEFGRDLHGGISDGWRGAGLSEERFAEKCIAAMDIYQRDGIPVMTYCFGSGFDNRWQSFNVERAGTWLNRVSQYNASAKDVPTGAQGQPQPAAQTAAASVSGSSAPKPANLSLQEGTLAKLPDGAQYVNQRAAPNTSAAIIQRLFKNDPVRFGSAAEVAGWFYVEKENAGGWVSAQDGRVIFAALGGEAQPLPAEPPLSSQLAAAIAATAALNADAGGLSKLNPSERAQAAALLVQIANLSAQVSAILKAAAGR